MCCFLSLASALSIARSKKMWVPEAGRGAFTTLPRWFVTLLAGQPEGLDSGLLQTSRSTTSGCHLT
jgi:hypothetical protein